MTRHGASDRTLAAKIEIDYFAGPATAIAEKGGDPCRTSCAFLDPSAISDPRVPERVLALSDFA